MRKARSDSSYCWKNIYIKAKLMEIVEKSPLEINNFCEDQMRAVTVNFKILSIQRI